MEKGFNSDIMVQGSTYHVQTEDWGHENPFLVSRIYFNGAVIKSVKTHYKDAPLNGPASDRNAIRAAMREQHEKILDQLISGKLMA